jgi:hypothetical protein
MFGTIPVYASHGKNFIFFIKGGPLQTPKKIEKKTGIVPNVLNELSPQIH